MAKTAKTKIMATVGPACDSEAILEAMIKAGTRAFRFNMKHNTRRWHERRLGRVKEAGKRTGRAVAILMDLQGPEVRVGRFKGKIKKRRVRLGEEVIFSQDDLGRKMIPLDSEKLVAVLKAGDRLLLDDGQLEFEVKEKTDLGALAVVRRGGVIEERKGVNFPQIEMEGPVLGKADLSYLSLAGKAGVDYLALSFVRKAEEIKVLKKEMRKRGVKAVVVAKIETKQAVENFDQILRLVEGVMVARGDLGVEIEMEKVPYLQKEIIRKSREAGKPVIVATQMLESMIEKPRPTRAEVSDVANAVYDGADWLMLSGETAVGDFPVKAVETMRRVISFIEEKKRGM